MFFILILLGLATLYALFVGLRAWFAQIHHMNKRIKTRARVSAAHTNTKGDV